MFKVIPVPATFHTYRRDLETVELAEELRRISVLSYPDIQCNLDLSQCLSGIADTELWMLPICHYTQENHIRTECLYYHLYYTAVCFRFITKVTVTSMSCNVDKVEFWHSEHYRTVTSLHTVLLYQTFEECPIPSTASISTHIQLCMMKQVAICLVVWCVDIHMTHHCCGLSTCFSFLV
jgi:hypothetical protein